MSCSRGLVVIMIATINGTDKDFEPQDGPILFACTGHAGQINSLLLIAGELSRRRVSGLWFAAADERHTNIDGAINGSPIHSISCGTHDLIEGLFKDPAFYAAFANHRPMTAKSTLTLVSRLLDPARVTADYQQMLAHIFRRVTASAGDDHVRIPLDELCAADFAKLRDAVDGGDVGRADRLHHVIERRMRPPGVTALSV